VPEITVVLTLFVVVELVLVVVVPFVVVAVVVVEVVEPSGFTTLEVVEVDVVPAPLFVVVVELEPDETGDVGNVEFDVAGGSVSPDGVPTYWHSSVPSLLIAQLLPPGAPGIGIELPIETTHPLEVVVVPELTAD
jgi:hypothetical protein